MTAYELMGNILDCNETMEHLKDLNAKSMPNLDLCKAVDLLTTHRNLCVTILKNIDIENSFEKISKSC